MWVLSLPNLISAVAPVWHVQDLQAYVQRMSEWQTWGDEICLKWPSFFSLMQLQHFALGSGRAHEQF